MAVLPFTRAGAWCRFGSRAHGRKRSGRGRSRSRQSRAHRRDYRPAIREEVRKREGKRSKTWSPTMSFDCPVPFIRSIVSSSVNGCGSVVEKIASLIVLRQDRVRRLNRPERNLQPHEEARPHVDGRRRSWFRWRGLPCRPSWRQGRSQNRRRVSGRQEQ